MVSVPLDMKVISPSEQTLQSWTEAAPQVRQRQSQSVALNAQQLAKPPAASLSSHRRKVSHAFAFSSRVREGETSSGQHVARGLDNGQTGSVAVGTRSHYKSILHAYRATPAQNRSAQRRSSDALAFRLKNVSEAFDKDCFIARISCRATVCVET